MKKSILLIYVLFLVSEVFGQWANIRVSDPQNLRGGQGTIEEALLSIEPKGAYLEYGLYLTFSARNLGFTHTDTVEVEMNFSLPNNSIVSDSWLWFEGEIIKGEILDKWIASQIYESIVKRRRDPSILIKERANRYQLKIFPMAGDETRRVKLTYLVPANWTSKNVNSNLPLGIIQASQYKVKTFYLISQLGDEWSNPKINELPEKIFEEKYDSTFGNFWSVKLNQSEISKGNLTFSVDAPFTNGIYLNRFEGSENIYQLAYLPSEAISIEEKYKTAILFDYNASTSDISREVAIANVKTMLLNHFTEQDSFNLIFSNLEIKRISENWLPASQEVINSVFDNLSDDILSNYSSLPSLLANGIEFINHVGTGGEIILVANSTQVGAREVANELIEDLIDTQEENVPINICDFANQNLDWHRIGNRSYSGNEYFYENITKLTKGVLFRVDYNATFTFQLNKLFESLGGQLTTYDLHTTLENGFCYSRFGLNSSTQKVSLNTPIIQIGKYDGSFPFEIEFAGVHNSQAFSESYSVTEENIYNSDSVSSSIWAGNFINNLEVGNYNLTNEDIGEIIDFSIENRVLSMYTAFLCLEPGMDIDTFKFDDGADEWVTSVEDKEEIKTDSIFQAYPNPFNNQTTIQIRLSKEIDMESVSFKIYDILGRVVKTFEQLVAANSREVKFIWNGKNDNNATVSSGHYFFIMNQAGKVKTMKLLLLK
ncbi:MAG: VIT domain-containing protein [Melioribacteraceae bacterium]